MGIHTASQEGKVLTAELRGEEEAARNGGPIAVGEAADLGYQLVPATSESADVQVGIDLA